MRDPVSAARCFVAVSIGVAAPAMAADPVTLYGVVDAGIMRGSDGRTSTVRQSSGLGSTSRWGLGGVEDLGGGWRAAFQLESSFQSDQGSVGGGTRQGDAAFFNRESNVSLAQADIGTIKLGRQFPTQLSLALDPFLGVSGFSPFASLLSANSDLGRGATIGDSRIGNAVSYSTPARHDGGGHVLYGFGESAAAGAPRASDYGVEIHYRQGAMQYLGAQFNVIHTDPVAGSPSFRNHWGGVGTLFVLGQSSLSYQFNWVAPQVDGYQRAQVHAFGWTYAPNSRDVFKASFVWRHVTGPSSFDSSSVGVGYEYNFSRSTALYARLGYVANRPDAVSPLAGMQPGARGNDIRILGGGVRMRF